MPVGKSGVSDYANTTSGSALGVVAGSGVSGSGTTVAYSGGVPANVRILEDGTYRVLEDGSTYRVTE